MGRRTSRTGMHTPGALDALEKDWKGLPLGPKAPALRWLWKEEATGAFLDFLESTRVGCGASAEMARVRTDGDRGREDAWSSEGSEGGPGPP